MESNNEDRSTSIPAVVEQVSAHLLEEGMIDSPEVVPPYALPEAFETTRVVEGDSGETGSDDTCVSSNIVLVAAQQIEVVEGVDDEQTRFPHNRAEFVSATIIRKSADERLGLSVEDDLGEVHVSALEPDSIFRKSPLCTGDKLLSINGMSCVGMSPQHAANVLQQATGTLTVIAHNVGGDSKLVETMIEKPTPNTLVGIGLRSKANGRLVISKVEPNGLFSLSLLNAKDRVISINGIESRRLPPKSAVKIIRNSPRFVTVVTETQRSTGVVIAAASVHPFCAMTEEVEPERSPDAQGRNVISPRVIAVAVFIIVLGAVPFLALSKKASR